MKEKTKMKICILIIVVLIGLVIVEGVTLIYKSSILFEIIEKYSLN